MADQTKKELRRLRETDPEKYKQMRREEKMAQRRRTTFGFPTKGAPARGREVEGRTFVSAASPGMYSQVLERARARRATFSPVTAEAGAEPMPAFGNIGRDITVTGRGFAPPSSASFLQPAAGAFAPPIAPIGQLLGPILDLMQQRRRALLAMNFPSSPEPELIGINA